jgi:hypothetical protein
MKRGFVGVGLLALLLVWPAVAADKKNAPAPAKDATANDYQALADAHTAVGKLVSVGGSDKSLNFRIEYQVLELNPNAPKGSTNNLLHLLHEQQQLMRTHNPLLRAVKLQQYEVQVLAQQTKAINKAFKVTKEQKDFDLASTPNVAVRYLEMPQEYDEKGNLKKYTAAELKELKGKNPDLPGYEADFDKLTPGQTVKVTLAKPKPAKDKEKDAAADDKKPQVSMIVILADAPQTDAPAKGKKKNK